MTQDNGMDVSPSWQELKAENDALKRALTRQAAAAKTGMNAAKEYGAHMEAEAKRLHAECNPEALESERQANSQLTEENAALAAHVADWNRLHSDATNGDYVTDGDGARLGMMVSWDWLERADELATQTYGTSLARLKAQVLRHYSYKMEDAELESNREPGDDTPLQDVELVHMWDAGQCAEWLREQAAELRRQAEEDAQ